MQQVHELLAWTLRLLVLSSALLAKLVLGVLGGVGVETEQNLSVAQRVLLLDTSSLGGGIALGLLENGLHFGAVDQAGDVGVGDEVGWEKEVFLQGGWLGGGAVDGIQGFESSG